MGIAVAATGTQVQIGDGGGTEVFTTIAEVGDVDGPGLTTATEEVPAHDGNGWMQRIATLKDAGEISFTMWFNNAASQTALWNDYNSRVKRNFKIIIPTTVPKTFSFAAFVTSFSFNLPVAGALSADVTLTANDAVTMA
jgi:predicted secreted protein